VFLFCLSVFGDIQALPSWTLFSTTHTVRKLEQISSYFIFTQQRIANPTISIIADVWCTCICYPL